METEASGEEEGNLTGEPADEKEKLLTTGSRQQRINLLFKLTAASDDADDDADDVDIEAIDDRAGDPPPSRVACLVPVRGLQARWPADSPIPSFSHRPKFSTGSAKDFSSTVDFLFKFLFVLQLYGLRRRRIWLARPMETDQGS